MPTPSIPRPLTTVSRVVVGGIDTHKDLHVAAVIDTAGAVLASQSFSTTRAGYRALLRWMRSFGDLRMVGIEGTGSYGAGVTRHLTQAGVESWRSTGPTAATGGGVASPTTSTRWPPPGRR